jgi:hypothetical protein
MCCCEKSEKELFSDLKGGAVPDEALLRPHTPLESGRGDRAIRVVAHNGAPTANALWSVLSC